MFLLKMQNNETTLKKFLAVSYIVKNASNLRPTYSTPKNLPRELKHVNYNNNSKMFMEVLV